MGMLHQVIVPWVGQFAGARGSLKPGQCFCSQGFPEKHGKHRGPSQPKCGAYALDPVLIKRVRGDFPASCRRFFNGTAKWPRSRGKDAEFRVRRKAPLRTIRAEKSSIVSQVRIPKARSGLTAHKRSLKPGKPWHASPQGRAGVRRADDLWQCFCGQKPVRGIAYMAAPRHSSLRSERRGRVNRKSLDLLNSQSMAFMRELRTEGVRKPG